MNAPTAAGDAPVRPLRTRRMKQSRIPHDRDRYRTAVHQVGTHRVVSYTDILDPLAGFWFRTTHAIPPGASLQYRNARHDWKRAAMRRKNEMSSLGPKRAEVI